MGGFDRKCWRCSYWILTTDHTVIACSTICPAYHPGHQNLRQAEGEDVEAFRPPPASTPQVDTIQNDQDLQVLPVFDPMDIVGKTFIKTHNGFPHKAEVLKPMEDGSKFLVALGDGEREEILTYNDIMNLCEDQLDEDNDQVWSFEAVLGHRKKKGKI